MSSVVDLHLELCADDNALFFRSAQIELSRFKGRPGELSPKARFWLFAGWLLPARFK